MSQEQNYQVNYTIAVDATPGTKQVMAFADSIGHLVRAKADLTPAITNIKKMMTDIDATFRTKSGKKRDYSFKFNIDTNDTEAKLNRVKVLLTDIGELTKGVNLVINAGQKVDTRSIKSQVQVLTSKKELDRQQEENRQKAATAVKSVLDTRKMITCSIGKIHSAVASLERGREVNIKTDVAKSRLEELLVLMRQIRKESNFGMIMPGVPAARSASGVVVPYAYQPEKTFTLSQKGQERLFTAQKLYEQKSALSIQEMEAKQRLQSEANAAKRLEREQFQARKLQGEIQKITLENQLRIEREAAHRMEKELERKRKEEEKIRKKALSDREKQEKEKARLDRQSAVQSIQEMQRRVNTGNALYGKKRRAAINRIQYSKAPSMRGLPMVGTMMNAYMAYNFVKSELQGAMEYANTMESARSILRVADGDLSTFDTRFEQLGQNMRQIGVDTKFTAVQIASATKFLAMAGMDVATINASMRPITNLALIGDNDVGLIADLATNIMSGYNISGNSMGSVADIITSTISRANVNVVEMAESFKMAAGYLKLAGVDFTEASAAIGILGNAGMKGTMAGTALRAMATRFAKPTKQAEETLDRLGVKFTHFVEIAGKKVEKLRPLADIFKDLHTSGASLEDMIAIFSKIGGNAAMQFVVNYDKLRILTTQNRASHGLSDEQALVKQNTTKGLWAQMTSTLTESFMQAYEVVEPAIKGVMKDFLSKFRAKDFAQGLVSIGRALLDVCSLLANIATWMTRNFHWLEPLLFTGFVATRLFKLAGAMTNLGVAIGFIGKQSVASSTLELLSSLTGGAGGLKALSFGNKRAIVSALQGAGITGKGAMRQALISSGVMGKGMAVRGAFTSLFANQVATGSGITGAVASLSAIGTGAIAATAGISALIGALGWVAYKTWQIKEAKDAVLEEVNSNQKYHYPSIEALHEALHKTYTEALRAKEAVKGVTEGKSLEEESGQKIGMFTKQWWVAFLSNMAASQTRTVGGATPAYTFEDAYQQNTKDAINIIARKSGQQQINAAYAALGNISDPLEVGAFIDNIDTKYKYDSKLLNKKLYTIRGDKVIYNPGMENISARDAAGTPHFAEYQNTEVIRNIRVGAESYLDAMRSQSGAMRRLRESGFNFTEIFERGFFLKGGKWMQKEPGKNATDEQRRTLMAGKQFVKDRLVTMMATLRDLYGGNEQIAENIMKRAGFSELLYANEPGYNDENPFNAMRITTDGADDGMAGGNYSGTGKLSSAAPKQVVVQITNLLSVGTIDLMKSKEGQEEEIKGLKEQLAQALIDVVHEFDETWHG